ncbi:AraC family transcriptional regulator [Pyxidicoccus xibeiensis]|uniref:AraC family transcriptional regulator n=1 Tax=Pyxidicoccus xibeiensis TaxID=2906759 RepID=UPI0020A75486|nr:AraC family transcriptional regulator ligand-binding domain-containing protein [Pyxidicoccus xibeiensis]MCP3139451.1 AraC family transcriptional regulator [Pyxidicoccus xibeiensis]
MPETVTVATYFVRPLRRFLAARGVDASRVFPAGLPEAEGRIELEAAAGLWRAAAEVDPLVGLRVARELVPGDFGALEYAARSSPTLRAAFERVSRYHGLLNDRSRVTLSQAGGEVRIRYLRPGIEARMPPSYVEFVLGSWMNMCLQLADTPLMPARVLLPHPAPRDTSLHRAVFGEGVRFGGEEAELHFLAGVLDTALPRGDASLASVLDRHVEQLLLQARATRPWSTRVGEDVARQLADGVPRLEQVAGRLGVSPRALRRRLEEEGTTFARVVDELRRGLALELTRNPGVSLGELAFLLGFSEPSAFHRAFRRWTGRTPRGG